MDNSYLKYCALFDNGEYYASTGKSASLFSSSLTFNLALLIVIYISWDAGLYITNFRLARGRWVVSRKRTRNCRWPSLNQRLVMCCWSSCVPELLKGFECQHWKIERTLKLTKNCLTVRLTWLIWRENFNMTHSLSKRQIEVIIILSWKFHKTEHKIWSSCVVFSFQSNIMAVFFSYMTSPITTFSNLTVPHKVAE